MRTDYIIEQLKSNFQGRETFSKDELFNFYRNFDPQLNESTFHWRIYNLKEKKIIRAVTKSEFSLSYKPIYKPDPDKKLREIYSILDREYPTLKKAIWSTQWMAEFMLHIPGRYWTLLEVEKDSVESVFFFLKDHRFRDVFLQPEEKEIDWYIKETYQPIILKSLITLSPLQKNKKVKVPKLEKILMDIFTDKIIFSVFQGHELSVIFNNAYEKYQINFSKMMTYARRRGKEKDLMEFISNKTDIPNSIFND